MIWTFPDKNEQPMHHMMGHFGMDHGSNDANDANYHQSSGNYSNDGWGGIPANSYSSPQQTSPVYEDQNYQFMNHGLPHSLPEEPTFTRMPLPAAPQQTFLPILPAPMENPPTWMSSMPIMPSSLTNPDIHPIRPVAKAPNSGRVKAPKQTPNPARVRLQDHQRKDMCIFHAKYPEVKQAQIGSESHYSCRTMNTNVCGEMFGVERRYAFQTL
jgi:hypothetical protein